MASVNNGVLLVISAPSGCGKDSVIRALKSVNDTVKQSVSTTTRKIREGETDGIDYNFTTVNDFKEKIEQGYFLEYVNYGENFYGTPKKKIDEMLSKGDCVVLKIEVEGAGNIRKIYPDAVTVFIIPPSMDELKNRLRGRGTETEEEFNKRVSIAATELTRASEYDYIVINDELSSCAESINEIINAERHRFNRMKDFVEKI